MVRSSKLEEKSTLYQSVLTGVAWQYTAVGIQAAAQLATLTILSRLLAPEDFGAVGAASVFVGFTALFSQLGVGPAIIQRRVLTSHHVRAGSTVSIVIGALMALLMWSAAPMIAVFFRHAEIAPIVRGISWTFVFASIGAISEALLQRDMKFRLLMYANVGSYVVGYGILGVWLASVGYGVWALVYGTVFQSILRSGFLLCLRPVSLKPCFRRQPIVDLLQFGAGFTLARGLNYMANQGDYTVVGRLMGASALGVYTRAYQLMLLPASYFGQALERVVFPAMARVQNSKDRLAAIFLVGTTIVSLVTAPLTVMMVVCAPEIISVLLGDQWQEVVLPFQILSLGVLFRTSYKLGDSLAKASGAVYRRSVREALYAALVIVGSIAGIRWGLSGVAIGVLIAIAINYVAAAQMSLNILQLGWQQYLRTHWGGVILAAIVCLVAVGTRVSTEAIGISESVRLLLMILCSGLVVMLVIFRWPVLLGNNAHRTLQVLFGRLYEVNRALGTSWLLRRYMHGV